MVNNEKIATLVKAQQEWERIGLSNNFVFQKVMQNKELCKKVLEEILGFEIDRVEYTEYEKTIDIRNDAKAVRLDVYVKGNKNTVYNIEMQNAKEKDLPKRGRYYQDMVDMDLLEKGWDYEDLNESIIIFVCTFDYYELGRCKYTFNNTCEEEPGLKYGDETTKIIINTKGNKEGISEDFRIFLDAINGYFSDCEFSDRLKSEVEKVKRSEFARREYMNSYLFEHDIRKRAMREGREEGLAQGKEEGLAQGREEGREKGREEGIKIFIRDNISEGKTAEQIIDKLVRNYQIDEDKAKEYYEKYK